jgi:hypothetical protein
LRGSDEIPVRIKVFATEREMASGAKTVMEKDQWTAAFT